MARQLLYVDCDNLLRYDRARNSSDGEYLNAATVMAALLDADGDPVAGAESITLSKVAGVDGRYEGVILSTVALVAGALYTIEITLVEGVLDDFRSIPAIALERGTG